MRLGERAQRDSEGHRGLKLEEVTLTLTLALTLTLTLNPNPNPNPKDHEQNYDKYHEGGKYESRPKRKFEEYIHPDHTGIEDSPKREFEENVAPDHTDIDDYQIMESSYDPESYHNEGVDENAAE